VEFLSNVWGPKYVRKSFRPKWSFVKSVPDAQVPRVEDLVLERAQLGHHVLILPEHVLRALLVANLEKGFFISSYSMAHLTIHISSKAYHPTYVHTYTMAHLTIHIWSKNKQFHTMAHLTIHIWSKNIQFYTISHLTIHIWSKNIQFYTIAHLTIHIWSKNIQFYTIAHLTIHISSKIHPSYSMVNLTIHVSSKNKPSYIGIPWHISQSINQRRNQFTTPPEASF
jgi:hypothetical protein